MTDRHEDFGPGYAFSDHKRGDTISYRVEDYTEAGEILWIAPGGKLSNEQDLPPHYWVAPERGGFPRMVLFGDVVVDVR